MTPLSHAQDRDGSTMTGVTRLAREGEGGYEKMSVWTLHESSDGYRGQGERLKDVYEYICGYMFVCSGRASGSRRVSGGL